jgi:type IV fimbrial biogenesis protein FimT
MKRRAAGFTLVELLVIVVIIGIAFSLALPGFQGMIQRNRLTTNVNDMLVAINLARSEAMRRGSSVTVQSADDGAEAVNEFGNGYCVQVGVPGATGYSDSCTYSAARCGPPMTTGCIIRQFEALSGNATINSVENAGALTFGSMGELLASNVANLDVCDTEAEGRRIRVSLIGRSKSHRAVPGETASTDPACP